MVHLEEYQQSPNTKMEIGRILETWLKLDMVMVQLPQDLSQWLLVVDQMMAHRKCIRFTAYLIIMILYKCLNMTIKHDNGALGIELFGKPNDRSDIESWRL